jgi:hypothetical protein
MAYRFLKWVEGNAGPFVAAVVFAVAAVSLLLERLHS